VAFIDERRGRFGVQPICDVLREHGVGIAPNTYHVARNRAPSKRASRDEELMVEVQRVFDENLFVYGADKVWTQLNRENIRVARCTVERLMRHMGLCGARRGKAFTVTTTSDIRRHTERAKPNPPRSGHASYYTNPTQNNAPTDGSNCECLGVRLHRRHRGLVLPCAHDSPTDAKTSQPVGES